MAIQIRHHGGVIEILLIHINELNHKLMQPILLILSLQKLQSS